MTPTKFKSGKMYLTGVVQVKSCSPDRKKIPHVKLNV